MKRLRFKLLFIISLLPLFSVGNQDTLKIGVVESEPFVYKIGDKWTGVTMEILDNYLHDNNTPYEIVSYEKNVTYDELIDSMVVNDMDMLVGDITVTSDRIDKVEFSQPYYVTNTTIASLDKTESSFISGLFTLNFLLDMLSLLAFILLSGMVIWLVERKHNEGFDNGIIGIFDGSYFVSATMTTVGYGDVSPNTKFGKVLAFILMWLSLGMVGIMYGNITTSLTVSELENEIKNVSELNKLKVGTIGGTTSSTFLRNNEIKYIEYSSTEEGMEAIVSEELDAFVYDKPILEYYTGKDKYSHIILSENEFMEQTYGFVLNKDSHLTEGLNKSIIETIRSEEWSNITNKYNITK